MTLIIADFFYLIGFGNLINFISTYLFTDLNVKFRAGIPQSKFKNQIEIVNIKTGFKMSTGNNEIFSKIINFRKNSVEVFK